MPGMTRPDLFFEKRYIACRTLEKRMYSDEEVIKLPECPATHPHYREWRMRRASAGKLCAYLATKKKPLAILEIGCGNGWMLHQLSTISRTSLTGVAIIFITRWKVLPHSTIAFCTNRVHYSIASHVTRFLFTGSG
jgi:hypothetical protein